MTTQWFVKDLSKLTGVSVQTLHHYDRIGLLTPSIRMSNGYRVYSDKDLLKLQQIIALKFFGFELSQIKNLLSHESDALQHFKTQALVLERKAALLTEGAKTLLGIINAVDNNKSIPWKTIIQLIEVYKMTENLEHNWVKEIFTPEELKQYAEFESALKANATPQQQMQFEKSWDLLVTEVKTNLKQDPNSALGIQLGKKLMDWVNGVYGKKYAHLRTKKFEQGFAEGKGLEEAGLTPEIVAWMDKAMDAYWYDRIYRVLKQVGKIPAATVLELWHETLDDMYGDEDDRKHNIREMALADGKVSNAAKAWLRSLKNNK